VSVLNKLMKKRQRAERAWPRKVSEGSERPCGVLCCQRVVGVGLRSTQVHAAAALLAHGATGGATGVGAEKLLEAVRALCGSPGHPCDASLAAAALRTTGLMPALLTLIRRALAPPDSACPLEVGPLGLATTSELSLSSVWREHEHGEMDDTACLATTVARPNSPAASTSSEEGEDASPLPSPPPASQPPPEQQKAGEATVEFASALAALAKVRAADAAAAAAAMALVTEVAEAAEASGDRDSTRWIAQQVRGAALCALSAKYMAISSEERPFCSSVRARGLTRLKWLCTQLPALLDAASGAVGATARADDGADDVAHHPQLRAAAVTMLVAAATAEPAALAAAVSSGRLSAAVLARMMAAGAAPAAPDEHVDGACAAAAATGMAARGGASVDLLLGLRWRDSYGALRELEATHTDDAAAAFGGARRPNFG
jgi:hypothetical protein